MKKLFLIIASALLLNCCVFENKQKQSALEAISSRTEMLLINGTSDTVAVFLTLGSDTNCVDSVTGVFGIIGSGLQGSFNLLPNDTVSYISPLGRAFEGNLSFTTAPNNCPDTLLYPFGINLFEFNLNDNFSYIANPQETIDISCVSGVNSAISCSVTDSTWNAGTMYPVVMTFRNSFIYDNTFRVGVYPFGCDTCNGIKSPPICPNQKKFAQPQKNKICNVQRNASSCGGKVYVTYNGVLNGTILK
jgi:hypothetical protein